MVHFNNMQSEKPPTSLVSRNPLILQKLRRSCVPGLLFIRYLPLDVVDKALKESGARPGQWVALPGAGGGLGHLAIQYANAMGFRVVAIDTGKEKEDLCMSLGAEVFVDFKTSPNVIEQVKKITDGGPHAAIIIAASAKPYEDALKMVRTKGTVVAVGLPSNTVIGADVFDTVVRSLTVKGSYVYVPQFHG